MNSAAFTTREKLITETWPASVQMRNPHFLSVVLHVDESTKHDLTVGIRETRQTSVSLQRHAVGGVKTPEKARTLAIPPSGTVTRTERGIPKDQRPRAIIQNTPRRALRITPRGIFVGQGGRLHLKYAFRPQAQQPADVPLQEVFATTMREKLFELLPGALKAAMRTRRS